MLIERYVEALLVDEDLADQVWEAWADGELTNVGAAWAWWAIVSTCSNIGYEVGRYCCY